VSVAHYIPALNIYLVWQDGGWKKATTAELLACCCLWGDCTDCDPALASTYTVTLDETYNCLTVDNQAFEVAAGAYAMTRSKICPTGTTDCRWWTTHVPLENNYYWVLNVYWDGNNWRWLIESYQCVSDAGQNVAVCPDNAEFIGPNTPCDPRGTYTNGTHTVTIT